jgi:hypothetical protein
MQSVRVHAITTDEDCADIRRLSSWHTDSVPFKTYRNQTKIEYRDLFFTVLHQSWQRFLVTSEIRDAKHQSASTSREYRVFCWHDAILLPPSFSSNKKCDWDYATRAVEGYHTRSRSVDLRLPSTHLFLRTSYVPPWPCPKVDESETKKYYHPPKYYRLLIVKEAVESDKVNSARHVLLVIPKVVYRLQ